MNLFDIAVFHIFYMSNKRMKFILNFIIVEVLASSIDEFSLFTLLKIEITDSV